MTKESRQQKALNSVQTFVSITFTTATIINWKYWVCTATDTSKWKALTISEILQNFICMAVEYPSLKNYKAARC
jgi:hypothetical protein